MTPLTQRLYHDVLLGDTIFEVVTEVRMIQGVPQRDEPPGRGDVGHTFTTLASSKRRVRAAELGDEIAKVVA